MTEETLAYLCEEMKKAERSLKAAKKLIEEKLTDDAISRAYYAVFHSARAVLKTKGVDTKTHQGLITQFALHLVKPGLLETEYGDILRQGKEDRETGDYEPFVTFDLEEAEKRVKDAERFIIRVLKYLKDSGFEFAAHERGNPR